MCDYDANAIIAESIPSRKSLILQKAFLTLFNKIKLKGCKLNIIRLDNGTSKDYLNFLK